MARSSRFNCFKKKWKVTIATVFTTHATLLGRYLAAGRVDLYTNLKNINPDFEAGNRQIYHRHWIEVGAARGSDIFTTVSEITGFEAEHLLGRKPDYITPNGLNVSRFVALHEFQNLHQKYKSKIHEFVRGHFFGNYDFDLDNTLYFFTAGRYEYFNKGVDLFIESLAELNHMLKQENSEMTIVAFIIMSTKATNYNVQSIQGQSIRREIRESCDRIVKKISDRMFEDIMRGIIPDSTKLLSPNDIVEIKRRVQTIRSQTALPPIVTHNIDDSNDEVIKHLKTCNLLNNKDDRVKIIYHPAFLNSTSPVLPLDYDQFVRGSHLGVFASYYEPWGYTPAECMLMGVPSITTNLTGFANFISKRVSDPPSNGLYIVDRRYKSFQESKSQMSNIMWQFCQLNRRQRITLRNKVERLSNLLDWRSLGKSYVKARNEALKRVFNFEQKMPEFFETFQQKLRDEEEYK